MGFQGSFKEKQGITRNYMGLKGITRGYKGLRGLHTCIHTYMFYLFGVLYNK